jgi:hypothetical protein
METGINDAKFVLRRERTGQAGKHRLDDARALMNATCWRGAIYVAE